MIDTTPALTEHLKFLANEVEHHCRLLEQFYSTGSPEFQQRVGSRSGYLSTLVERANMDISALHTELNTANAAAMTGATLGLISALSNLAKAASDAICEGSLPTIFVHPAADRHRRIVRRVRNGISLLTKGVEQAPIRIGIKLGRKANDLEVQHLELTTMLATESTDLSSTEGKALFTSALCTKLMIRYLREVGEALISANYQYSVTLKSFERMGGFAQKLSADVESLKIDRLALTRSGSAVAKLEANSDQNKELMAVYKEGDRLKVLQEIEGVKAWNKIHPGLTPKVLGHKDSESGAAAVLIEYFEGETLEAMLQKGSGTMLERAVSRLIKTLNKVWKASRVEEKAHNSFMSQLQKRLPEVQRVHPSLNIEPLIICGLQRPGLQSLMQEIAERESAWAANFSVMIHGDFNVDNIIFNSATDQIRFIDVHRAQFQDYVQDISVLMVSIYRLHIIHRGNRRPMMRHIQQIYGFGQRFAKRNMDPTFELRLACGLARSLITSTRFITDTDFSSKLHQQALYLLETMAGLSKRREMRFKVPVKELFID